MNERFCLTDATNLTHWHYVNPVAVQFGAGAIEMLAELSGGQRTVLVTSQGALKRGVVNHVATILGKALVGVLSNVTSNPTLASIAEAHAVLKELRYDLIVALGGGSAIDTAKALAAIEAGGGPSWLERHLKEGESFPRDFGPGPVVAVPTTAGSGSEVTMWATVWDMEEKKSILSAIRSSTQRPLWSIPN